MKKILVLSFACLFAVAFCGMPAFSAEQKSPVKVSANKTETQQGQKIQKTAGAAQDNASLTMALNAAAAGDLDSVKYLITEKELDINSVSQGGTTILMKACCSQNLDLVKYLLENGAGISAVNGSGYNALMYAVEQSNLEVVRYLFEGYNLNMDEQAQKQKTLLVLALHNGDTRIIKYLMESQDFKPQTGKKGETLLMTAAGMGNLEIVKYLLDAQGMDSDAEDVNGNTVLAYAVKSGNLDLVKYLVETVNADPDDKNNNGKKAVDIAVENGRPEIVKYLAQYNNN